jgi:hypothetical protein
MSNAIGGNTGSGDAETVTLNTTAGESAANVGTGLASLLDVS